MSRISATFATLQSQGRAGLVAFLTVGYPEVEDTPALVEALVEGGADVIELGVPFSDPLADGATIQRANYRALANGVTPATCLHMVEELRRRGITAPIVLMGYYNPILAWGVPRYVETAAAAGADGLIVVDLPVEEAQELHRCCHRSGLDLIFLVAPTSPEERIQRIAEMASGFLYCVSVTGITGARRDLPAGLSQFLARVRRYTALPLAVGFGVSRPEHVEAIGRVAEAAVVGSALLEALEGAAAPVRAQRVKEYVEVITGRRRASV